MSFTSILVTIKNVVFLLEAGVVVLASCSFLLIHMMRHFFITDVTELANFIIYRVAIDPIVIFMIW